MEVAGRGRAARLLVVPAFAVAAMACAAGSAQPAPSPFVQAESPASLVSLDHLVVAPEASGDGYDRALFPQWIDADGDGCDTRSEVLIAESLTAAQVDPVGCTVIAGDWVSLYDGYSTDDPTELEIDHVVALAEAWRSGASSWSSDRREAFANDLGNPELIAVTAATNRSKSDSDPATWQPPNRDAWCSYAEDWIAVKAAWGLTVDAAEVRALHNMLTGCP